MEYVLTFNNIYASDNKIAGRRAVDMAMLARNHYKVPLSFVLNARALESFVEHNQLKQRGAQLLASQDYEGLHQAFLASKFPESLLEEIREAYDTLSVDNQKAESIVSSGGDPSVTIIPSTDYPTRGPEGIQQGIKGFQKLLEGIKKSWASLFTRQAFTYRTAKGIREFYSALIVEKEPKCTVSSQTVGYVDGNSITVRAYWGHPDFLDQFEKDLFQVSKEGLQITQHQVRHQIYRFSKDEDDRFVKVPLEGKGSEQKANDKQVVELARLTKKMMTQFQSTMTGDFCLKGEGFTDIMLINCTRLDDGTSAPRPTAAPAPVSEDQKADIPEPSPTMKAPAAPMPEKTVPEKEHKPLPETEPPSASVPEPDEDFEVPVPDKPVSAEPHDVDDIEEAPEPPGPAVEAVPEPEMDMPEDEDEPLMPVGEEDFLDELEKTKAPEELETTEKVFREPVEEVEPSPYGREDEDSWDDEPEQVPDEQDDSGEDFPNLPEEFPGPSDEHEEDKQEDLEEPEEEKEDIPEEWQDDIEEVDYRIEHVSSMKEILDKIDSLVREGDDEEIHEKLKDLQREIDRIRSKS